MRVIFTLRFNHDARRAVKDMETRKPSLNFLDLVMMQARK